MRQGQFGVYSLQRRLQTSKLHFYVEIIIAEAVVCAATSKPRPKGWRPKTVEIADGKICVRPPAMKVGF
jgi:hypothetical protein